MSDYLVQLGDLANRLGRALGITGKINTSLRDPTLPVALLVDLSKAPYADSPIFFSGFLAQTSAAGTTAYVGLLAKAARTLITSVEASSNSGTTTIAAVVLRQASGLTIAGGNFNALNVPGGLSQAVSVQANTLAGVSSLTAATVANAQSLPSSIRSQMVPFVNAAPVVLFPGDAFLVEQTSTVSALNVNLAFAEYPR